MGEPSQSPGARARVAFLDDEAPALAAWRRELGDELDLATFDHPLAFLERAPQDDYDVAVLDLHMPAMDGLEVLRRLRVLAPRTVAIVLTGSGSVAAAVEAMKLGAADFLSKPVRDLAVLRARIDAACERSRLARHNAELRARIDAFGPHADLVGESPKIERIRSFVQQIADAPGVVLLCGESGTGKELLARSLHEASARRAGPFVAVNCAALSDTLVDSELFGHERGAFTGAQTAHRGLFEAADGGTLFLDEIGDVAPGTQVRLLRALQEGEVRPVGSTKSRSVDVRVITATNIDLQAAIKRGAFREDLYYRISTFRIDVPRLAERGRDVLLIAQFLLQKYNRQTGRTIRGFSDETLSLLVGYDWPGNVRELANVVQYAATLCRGEQVEPQDLPASVTAAVSERAAVASWPSAASAGELFEQRFSEARAAAIASFERQYLTELMQRAEGNISQASRLSGIDRANLRRLLARYELTRAGHQVA